MVSTVVGLDLSLTATGACRLPGGGGAPFFETFRWPGGDKHPGARLGWLQERIEKFIAGAELVTIEGLHVNQDWPMTAVGLGELHGVAKIAAWKFGALVHYVQPAAARAAVLGFVPTKKMGNVKKLVAERLRFLGVKGFKSNDEADAWVLARYGADLLRAGIIKRRAS